MVGRRRQTSTGENLRRRVNAKMFAGHKLWSVPLRRANMQIRYRGHLPLACTVSGHLVSFCGPPAPPGCRGGSSRASRQASCEQAPKTNWKIVCRSNEYKFRQHRRHESSCQARRFRPNEIIGNSPTFSRRISSFQHQGSRPLWVVSRHPAGIQSASGRRLVGLQPTSSQLFFDD